MSLWNKIKNAAMPKQQDDRNVKWNSGMNQPEPTVQQVPPASTAETEHIPSFDQEPHGKRTITPIIDAPIVSESADGEQAGTDGPKKDSIVKTLTSSMSQRQKQMAIILGVVMAFAFLVLTLVTMSNTWTERSKAKSQETVAQGKEKLKAGKMTLLSERVERDLWVAAEGQNIKAIQQSNEQLQNEVKALRDDLETTKKAQMEAVTATNKNMEEAIKKAKQQGGIPIPPPPGKGPKTAAYSPNGPQKIGGIPPVPGTGAIGPAGSVMGAIRMVEDDQKSTSRGSRDSAPSHGDRKKEDEWISTGSFFKAVLLNGIDAPTSGGAQAEPYPVLMSIVDLTTMPNRFQVDMRECFLVGAGYGNIADERCYIRSERLSCIRKNGQAVDFELTGHVIGEDGKLGMRGRLVSKQGQQIVMALFAGTLGGFSTAMKPTGTVKLDLSTNDTTTTVNRNDASDVLASAGLGGAGTALDSVAKYYLKMAEKMFPVIEIDAGRRIEVVVLKGRSMKDEKNLMKQTDSGKERSVSDYKAKQS